jgi:hypothetical protein
MLGLFLLLIQISTLPAASKRPPETLAMVEQASSLPREFSADTLLRLANSSLVQESKWKKELVEEAFWSGAHAPLPYQQWADRMDSLPTRVVRANRMEALTLQARAVETMLRLDSVRALQLFGMMRPLKLPDPDCSEIYTPDIAIYYKVTAEVYEQAFSEKERKDGDDIAFLKQRIAGIDSPFQLAPALKSILGLKLAPEQRTALLIAFAGALDRTSGGDRGYGAVEKDLMPEVKAEMADAPAFVAALRGYIVRQVRGRRCSNNVPAASKQPVSVEQFNALVLKLDPARDHFKPISAEEALPAGISDSYPSQLLWRSRQAKNVLAELQWLHHGDSGAQERLLTLEERSKDIWLQHFQETLKLMDDWKEEDEALPEEYFCMASDALNDLAALAPSGRIRNRAMSAYLEFLEEHYANIENHNLWFTQFRQMLYRARFSKDPAEKAWILHSMERSSNPIIALYSKLERLEVAP